MFNALSNAFLMTLKNAAGAVFVVCSHIFHMSCVMRKPVFGGSDLVRQKLICTTIEDDKRLEISDRES